MRIAYAGGVAIFDRGVDAWSSRLILNLEVEIKASRTTTLYSKVCKFDATADLEKLQIEKPSESPNDRVRFRFDLQIRLILELQPNIPLLHY